MKNKIIILSIGVLFAISGTLLAQWRLPPVKPPKLYGNILIDRVSTNKGVKAVTFSHWSHRTEYTCRVCHLELEFNMILNTTEISEEDNRNGRFCGACHDGKIAFDHSQKNCKKCHNRDIGYGYEKFKKFVSFPAAPYGNKIDWTQAWKEGLINPKSYLFQKEEPITFNKRLLLEAELSDIAPALFPHETHVKWLDCSNCHPEIFNVKKKTTKHFSMEYILNNKFCGVCHGTVAFPVVDCLRCHPDMKELDIIGPGF